MLHCHEINGTKLKKIYIYIPLSYTTVYHTQALNNYYVLSKTAYIESDRIHSIGITAHIVHHAI